ncbi:hypothetical protein VTH82DRAFT_663 [Thermothelomyces myriococcoides]
MSESNSRPHKLKEALDWPIWYEELEARARAACVWKYFDPSGDAATPATSESTTPTVKSSTNDDEFKPTEEEIEKYHDKLWDRHKFLVVEHNEIGKSVSRLDNWVISTVDASLYHATKARRDRTLPFHQGMIRALHEMKALVDSNYKTLVATYYEQCLANAKCPGVNPEQWIQEFHVWYQQAEKADIPEIKDARGLYAFLNAVGTCIRPTWAVRKYNKVREANTLGKPLPMLSQLAKLAEAHIIGDAKEGNSRKKGVFATT